MVSWVRSTHGWGTQGGGHRRADVFVGSDTMKLVKPKWVSHDGMCMRVCAMPELKEGIRLTNALGLLLPTYLLATQYASLLLLVVEICIVNGCGGCARVPLCLHSLPQGQCLNESAQLVLPVLSFPRGTYSSSHSHYLSLTPSLAPCMPLRPAHPTQGAPSSPSMCTRAATSSPRAGKVCSCQTTEPALFSLLRTL